MIMIFETVKNSDKCFNRVWVRKELPFEILVFEDKYLAALALKME